MPLKDFNEILANELKDPDAVAVYLEATLEEGGLETLLVALRNVAKIKGDAARLSETASLGSSLGSSREAALEDQGTPQFETLQSILNAYGLRFSITRNDSQVAMQASGNAISCLCTSS